MHALHVVFYALKFALVLNKLDFFKINFQKNKDYLQSSCTLDCKQGYVQYDQ